MTALHLADQYITVDFSPTRHNLGQELIHPAVSLVVIVALPSHRTAITMTACQGQGFVTMEHERL